MDFSLDYELLDFGNGRKLERFGNQVVDRPEVLATGYQRRPLAFWKEHTAARFIEASQNPSRWEIRADAQTEWISSLKMPKKQLELGLHLGSHKHVGVFPEQVKHWQHFSEHFRSGQRMLNLFAYTGVASIVAASLGLDVYHVDSSRSIIKQAKENAERNGLSTIHWVVEDALKFAEREAKRGNRYDCILLDPPIYGRGAKGEAWKLESHLPILLNAVRTLLAPKGMMILNTYSPQLSLSQQNQAAEYAGFKVLSEGELCVKTNDSRALALSKFLYGRAI